MKQGFGLTNIAGSLLLPACLLGAGVCTSTSHAAVTINEFMAANTSTLADEDGDFPDWIEVFNSGPGAADLGGWYLTDDSSLLAKWPFPATNLPAGKMLVVFASVKDRRTPGQPCTRTSSWMLTGSISRSFTPTELRSCPRSPRLSEATDGRELRTGHRRRDQCISAAAHTGRHECFHGGPIRQRHQVQSRSRVLFNQLQPGHLVRHGGRLRLFHHKRVVPSATNGTLYTQPIPISRTSVIRARAQRAGFQPSNVDTVTFLFLADVITQSLNGAPPPAGRVGGAQLRGFRHGSGHCEHASMERNHLKRSAIRARDFTGDGAARFV